MEQVRKRLTFANVVSVLALVLALGGGAYAVTIGRNDVGARQIAKNAVGTSELKNDKTKGKDVDESSLGQVPTAASATNAQQLDGVGPSGFLRYGAPIPSGVTLRGVWAGTEFNDNGSSTSFRDAVSFPAPAPAELTDADVNFADQGFAQPSDENSACAGAVANPTAPPGKVCIYADTLFGTANSAAGQAIANSSLGFEVRSESTNTALESQGEGTWAYTAP